MTPYIELNGNVTGILKKNSTHITFFFATDLYGTLLCTAKKYESILYYKIERNKKYKLKAILQGNTIEKDGGLFTKNHLYIKEVYEQKNI
jgi:hypothetical protein